MRSAWTRMPAAAAGQFSVDALEYVHVPTAALQHQRSEEPAHRAADDQRAPAPTHSAPLAAAKATAGPLRFFPFGVAVLA